MDTTDGILWRRRLQASIYDWPSWGNRRKRFRKGGNNSLAVDNDCESTEQYFLKRRNTQPESLVKNRL